MRRAAVIWWFAAGYFAAYVPYSALTKAISSGVLPGPGRAVSGFELLPASAVASMVGMFGFLSVAKLWRHVERRRVLGLRVPLPRAATFASGLATAAIIATTTLAYAVDGASIVFMMLLMRGGVLAIAPVVDALAGRHVRAASWIALALSLASLVVATQGAPDALSAVAAVDAGIYVGAYFLRLRLMSRLAKSADDASNRRYFVEEQMIASPAVVVALVLIALTGTGAVAGEIRRGFGDVAHASVLIPAVAIGLFSQGTGIFGGLILLERQENSYCIPVNRASSVLAGIVAMAIAAVLGVSAPPSARELAGAALIIAAIVVLASPLARRAVRRRGVA